MLGLPIGFARKKASPVLHYVSHAASALFAGFNLSMVISKPAGVVEGDFLLFYFLHAATPTIVSGNSEFTMDVNQVTSGHRVAAGYRVATGSEPVDYSWTMSTGNGAMRGVIVAYRPPLNTYGIGTASAGVISTSSSAHPMGSIHVVDKSMLAYGYLLDRAGFNALGSVTPPAGMTQRFYGDLSYDGRSDLGIVICDEYLAVGGTTGTRTLTTTANNVDGIGIGRTIEGPP